MIKTAGLHISLAVRDPKRAFDFYSTVFGLVEVERNADWITANGPGDGDLWAFEKDEAAAGTQGGVRHLGFRLSSPEDLEQAIAAVEATGGKLLNRGADDRTSPYAYVSDPDGYVLELWCE